MPKNYGLVGIDVAYVLAILGTMFMAVFFVIGDRQFYLAQHQGSYYIFLDFLPALLVFMSGMSFSLKMRDRRTSSRRKMYNAARMGSLLFLIGLLFVRGWSVNMFILLGMCYMMAGFVGQFSDMMLRILAVIVLFLAVFSTTLEVPMHPMFSGLKIQGAGLKELVGFTFFNGYYSFLPWFGFFVIGMIFGRGSVRPNGWFPPSSIMGLGLVILGFVLEIYSRKLYTPSPNAQDIGFYPLNIRFFMPSFIIIHSGVCVILVNILNYVFRKTKNRMVSDAARKLVEARFTLYFAVFFFGAIISGLFNLIIFRQTLVLFTLDLALCAGCVYLVLMWKRHLQAKPPIEWLIQRVTISTRD